METPTARCKFLVSAVTLRGGNYEEIHLTTSYDDKIPEDKKFAAATPSGEMKFNVTNPALCGRFKPGQYFYVDLVPVDGAGGG